MTPSPAPDPTAAPSTLDLTRIVDELEERTAAEAAREHGRRPEVDAVTDAVQLDEDAPGGSPHDLAHEVPGAPEPPD